MDQDDIVSIAIVPIKETKETIPHNGKPIVKMAISPKSEYIVTYSQEDKSFVGWSVDVDNNIKYESDWHPNSDIELDLLDLKVSDGKIIIINKGKFYK